MGTLKTLSEKNILTITVVLVFILGLLCIDQGHNWSDDFALYISQCEALMHGNIHELYYSNRFAMDNSYAHTGPYLYPLGFPLLLLPVYLIFGLNLYIMKVYCLLFFVASLPLIYLIFKKLKPGTNIPLIITLLIGFNYHFIRFSDNVLSDLPFFFFSLLSIYSIQKQQRTTVFKSFALGCLLFFTYCIRDIGILLLPCLLFFQISLLRDRKLISRKTTLIPFLVFALAWTILHYWMPAADDKHLEMFFGSSLEIIKNNLYYYWLLTGNYFVIFLGLPIVIKWIASAVFSIIILAGVFKNKTQQNYILIYIGLTLGLYFIWVSFQGMRFMFPLWPFLLFYLLEGLQLILKRKKLIHFAITILIASNLIQSCSVSYHYWNTDSNEACSKEMKSIYQFIGENLPEDAIIVFEKPRALRLFTGRNSVQKNIKEASYSLVPTTTNMNDYLFQTAKYTLLQK